jgi:hypothetical protein
MSVHPVRFRVDDDLERNRLTVFFRLVLALPHYLWAQLWAYALYVFVPFQWLATLFAGRMEDDAHGFITRFLRYHVHVYAYIFLLGDPWPHFRGRLGDYPIDVEIDGAERQNRWTVGFRLILAIPAIIFASVLATVLFVIGFLGWFVSLALGRMPKGMRDLAAYCLRYETQTYAYVLLLTQHYPSLGGGATGEQPPVVVPDGYDHDPMSDTT